MLHRPRPDGQLLGLIARTSAHAAVGHAERLPAPHLIGAPRPAAAAASALTRATTPSATPRVELRQLYVRLDVALASNGWRSPIDSATTGIPATP